MNQKQSIIKNNVTDTNPLNYLNSLFYASCPQAFTTSGLADFFVAVEPIQSALHSHILDLFPKLPLQIKEICSGSRPDRWQTISSLHTSPLWNVILSDFSHSSLPLLSQVPANPNLKISTELLDLFLPLSVLPPEQRFHVIFTTYGFDSLWFPEDVHYTKTSTGWAKTQFSLSADFQSLIPSDAIPPLEHLATFTPQLTQISVDLDQEPYGQEISDYYRNFNSLSTNFPGGLISKVQEFFARQLRPDGVFLSGDLAFCSSRSAPHLPPFQTSGKVAKFQTQDYGLASHILKKLGFYTQVITLNELIDRYQLYLPLDLSDHLFLQVSRRCLP